MTTGAEGAAVAAAAALAQAVKASGAIVRVEPVDFKTILWKNDNPLVVTAEGGLFKKNYQYLSAYKGLIFYTVSNEPLELGNSVEWVKAKSIWVPN